MPPLDHLNDLATRRQANWGAYPKTDAGLTFDLTAELEEAWSRFRRDRAQRRHGDASAIVKRARVEREIERLASSNQGVGK